MERKLNTRDNPQKCAHPDCDNDALTLADYCWYHLPDKREYLEKLKEWINTHNGDLQRFILERIDLTEYPAFRNMFERTSLQGADLRGANLQKAHLEEANLQEADLEEANLQEAHLWDANLQEANLLDAKLQKADLSDANLQEAHLPYAKLQKADLSDANLQEADLGFAKLQKADLQDANLQEANLRDANLQKAHLENADLQRACLHNTNLQQVSLKNANLQETISGRAPSPYDIEPKKEVPGAILRGAILQDANLKNAKFYRAEAQEANFCRANLEGAKLEYVNFKGAYLENTTLKNTTLYNVNFVEANLLLANLTEANILGEDTSFFEAKLPFAILANAKGLSKTHFMKKGKKYKFRLSKREKEDVLEYKESYLTIKNYFLQIGRYDDASWAAYWEKVLERISIYNKYFERYWKLLKEEYRPAKKGLKKEEWKKIRWKFLGKLVIPWLRGFGWAVLTSPVWLISLLFSALCGYGEKPWRVLISSSIIVFLFAFLFFKLGIVIYPDGTIASSFWQNLYFSIITFTNIGYGDMRPLASSWARVAALYEGVIGVFLIAIFAWTLGRRYSGR